MGWGNVSPSRGLGAHAPHSGPQSQYASPLYRSAGPVGVSCRSRLQKRKGPALRNEGKRETDTAAVPFMISTRSVMSFSKALRSTGMSQKQCRMKRGSKKLALVGLVDNGSIDLLEGSHLVLIHGLTSARHCVVVLIICTNAVSKQESTHQQEQNTYLRRGFAPQKQDSAPWP